MVYYMPLSAYFDLSRLSLAVPVGALKCAAAVTPDTHYTFLSVALGRQLLMMQWYGR